MIVDSWNKSNVTDNGIKKEEKIGKIINFCVYIVWNYLDYYSSVIIDLFIKRRDPISLAIFR